LIFNHPEGVGRCYDWSFQRHKQTFSRGGGWYINDGDMMRLEQGSIPVDSAGDAGADVLKTSPSAQ
jgi:hypothetical protein